MVREAQARSRRPGKFALLGALTLVSSLVHPLVYPTALLAHPDEPETLASLPQQRNPLRVITSRSVALTPEESRAGVVAFSDLIPVLEHINRQYNYLPQSQFQYFVQNFHYPYRERFFLDKQTPPAHVVLHWTANPRPEIPLYTLSAFLRSVRGGRLSERDNRYKNVSNYLLTGTLKGPDGGADTYLVKLTRGDIRSWGDIPRVTAYPTNDAHDDNKYDGRGALGIEIESPNFRRFYQNTAQRDKLHNFLVLVLQERGLLEDFRALRYVTHWEDMLALHSYLVQNLAKIDVNQRGGIPQQYQHLDQLLKHLPSISPQVYRSAQEIFKYISGHGIVAREYNARMIRSGRPKDARYHKIDFTEAHVFVVAMDLLQSDLRLRGIDLPPQYDLATLRLIEQQAERQNAMQAQSDLQTVNEPPPYGRSAFTPSGREYQAKEPF